MDETSQAKAIKTIELLQIHGSALTPPYSKKLSNGLYELRTSGQVTVRILYTNYQGIFYLLHAFKKQTLKNPQVKIEYDKLQPEFELISTLIKTRKKLD